MKERLLSTVTSLSAQVATDNPSVLIINATGQAPSAGYSNVSLELLDYDVEPSNGIYEFLFVGRPGETEEVKELTAVTADTFHWIDFPKSLKGIIVIGYENSLATSVREPLAERAYANGTGEENY